MGYTLVPAHGLQFSGFDGDRTHAGEVVEMESADEDLFEVDVDGGVRSGTQADAFMSENTAQEADASAPADGAFGTDAVDFPMGAISKGLGQWAITAWTLAIEASRRSLFEGFVGTLGIVVLAPTLVAPLLRAWGTGRRVQGFGFVDAMELFMGAIVLGLGAPGEVHPNAQAHPPQAQSRTAIGSGGSEGLTVVAAEIGCRQAITSKEAPESGPQGGLPDIGKNLDAQNHAEEKIAHSERFTALSIGGAKGAFEIDRPNIIGATRDLQILAITD